MSKSKKVDRIESKELFTSKEKTTKTEFHYQLHTTEHSLTYLKLWIEAGISCK